MNYSESEDIADVLNRQGIENNEHLYLFVALIKTARTDGYLECLLKTKESRFLISLSENDDVALILRDALIQSKNYWNTQQLVQVLHTLGRIPFTLLMLKKHQLGLKLKDVMKEAAAKNDTTVMNISEALKKQWKTLEKDPKKNSLSENSKLLSKTTPNVIRKPGIRLAIDKDPPKSSVTKAKSYSNPSLLDELLKVPKKSTNQTSFSQNANSLSSNSQSTAPTQANNTIPFRSAPVQATRYNQGPTPMNIDFPSNTKKSAKKKVTFADNLVSIREYIPHSESDNEEEIIAPKREMAIWYQPLPLLFNEEIDNAKIRRPVTTSETIFHDNRERTTLSKIYVSKKFIPFSPAEPDELPDPNMNTPVIPTLDVERQTHIKQPTQTHMPKQAPIQTPDPNMIEQLLRNNPAFIDSLRALQNINT
ncbi:hypothetical protein BY458DRAFT_209215 [Sporodiniella umbellata]|nr:hypothetical protein BY458DRAFT_209215 [Sporodiniella umbellata]